LKCFFYLENIAGSPEISGLFSPQNKWIKEKHQVYLSAFFVSFSLSKVHITHDHETKWSNPALSTKRKALHLKCFLISIF